MELSSVNRTASTPSLRQVIADSFPPTPERNFSYFKLLCGWDNNDPKSLAEIGRIEGISRERVRQLVKVAEKRILSNPLMSSFKKKWVDTIRDYTKELVSSDELVADLPSLAGFELFPETLATVLSRLFNIKLYLYRNLDQVYYSTKRVDINVDKDKVYSNLISTYGSNHTSEYMQSRLMDYLRDKGFGFLYPAMLSEFNNAFTLSSKIVPLACEVADEKYGDLLWSADVDEVIRRIACEPPYTHLNPTDLTELVSHALAMVRDRMRPKDNRLYSTKLYSVKFGSLPEVIDAVLLGFTEPKHHSVIEDEVRQWRPSFKKLGIYVTMSTRVDNAVMWDRGVYIHKNNVKVPYSLTSDVEKWLDQKLDEDSPFISIGGAYRRFKHRCNQSGVISESALYSCMRIAGSRDLVFPSIPLVYRREKYDDELTMLACFEEYMTDLGGPVSRDEIWTFWQDQVYLSDKQIEQLIPRTPGVIKLNESEYVHISNIRFDREILETVIDFAESVLEEEKHYSVASIFKQKQVSCKLANIESPYILYQLLEHFAEERIAFPHYPLIELTTNEPSEQNGISIFSRMVNYVLKERKPYSYSSIVGNFLVPHGYKEDKVYSLINHDDVLKYTRTSVVHLGNLDWNEDKQNEIEMEAEQLYTKATAAGKLYARVSDLIESDQLPSLPDNLSWSRELVVELLRRNNKFLVIGNRQEAFVVKNTMSTVYDLESLVAQILKQDWNGAANHTVLEQELARCGLIKKRLTRNMLSPGDLVVIVNGVVMLKELHSNA